MVEVDGTPIRIGTAGWRIPNELRDGFPDWGDWTQLWGYARRLEDAGDSLEEFLGRASELGDRLGVLLFQLPPSLEFDPSLAASFLENLRERHQGAVALEARHESWFREGPEELLREHGVTRVGADPPRAEEDGRPAAGEVWCIFDNTAEGEGTADALAMRERLGG